MVKYHYPIIILLISILVCAFALYRQWKQLLPIALGKNSK